MSTSQSSATTLTHRMFLVTIIGKATLGIIQLLIAAAVHFGMVARLPQLVQSLFARELSEDPNDFLASTLLRLVNGMPATDLSFYTLYFAGHGLSHVMIVAALLYGARWASEAAILVLSLFVVYQIFEWYSIGGTMLLVLSAIDIFVIILTVRERQLQRAAP